MSSKKQNYKAIIQEGDTDHNFLVTTLVFFDEGLFFVSCPSLNLIAYGKTEAEADINFKIQLEEFVTYIIKKGTIIPALTALGWKAQSKKENKFLQPSLLDLAKKDKDLARLFNSGEFKAKRTPVSLPV